MHNSPQTSPPLYPIFLSLHGLRCVVAGLGTVGQRKLAGLLACSPASVLALDIAEPNPEAAALLQDPRIQFARRSLTSEDLQSCAIVFASTNNPQENTRIATLCAERGIWCNNATTPEQGTFQVPAVTRQGALAAALSTGGASPALARQWKGELEQWLIPRSRMSRFMGRLRPLVLALGDKTEHNTALFRTLVASPLQELLGKGDVEACRRLLRDALPPTLHVHLGELLDDLA